MAECVARCLKGAFCLTLRLVLVFFKLYWASADFGQRLPAPISGKAVFLEIEEGWCYVVTPTLKWYRKYRSVMSHY
jgi:hypothetical protein